METPLLSIIIVSFNTKEALNRCLNSLADGLIDFKAEVEIIVIDNCSNDGSAELLKTYQWTTRDKKIISLLIFNNANLGFSKAVNQGLKKGRGKYFLLLNSDIVCRSGSITELVQLAQINKEIGLVAGKLLNVSGSDQPSVFHLPNLPRAIVEFWFGRKGAFQKYLPKGSRLVEVEAVVGAVMLIPKETVDRVGFFDEKYFMYFEDLDYCRRLYQKGLKIFYYPSAKFIHYHGQSGKKTPQTVSRYLIKSSKIYYGIWQYYLINVVIWISQKWCLLNGKREG